MLLNDSIKTMEAGDENLVAWQLDGLTLKLKST